MKRLTVLLFCLFSIYSNFNNALGNKLDSLNSIVKSTTVDTVKVNALVGISSFYLKSDPKQAIQYGNQALDLARTINFKKGQAVALKNIGIGYYMQSKYLETIDYWKQSLTVFQQLEDKVGIANINNNLGAIYFNQSDDANALSYYLKSLEAAQQTGDKLRIATAMLNIGGVYADKPATYDKALEYYLKALPISEATGDNDAIGTNTVNLGEFYFKKEDYKSALFYFEKSLKAYANSENKPYSLNYIGKVYTKRKDYLQAVKFHQEAFDISKKLEAKLDMTQSLIGLAEADTGNGNLKVALSNYKQAEEIAKEIKAFKELKEIYIGMSATYARLSAYGDAYKYQTLLTGIKDSIYNSEMDKKLDNLQFDFDIKEKQGQIKLMNKDLALKQLDLKRQTFAKNAILVGFILILVIAIIIYRNYRNKVKTNLILDQQKDEIESLLLNILPAEVAKELQQDGQATPRYYESVSVLFTDFKGFTAIAEGMAPNDLVTELNAFFLAFDDIIEKHQLEKIKTIGDAYMCAGGIPTQNSTHPISIIKAGLEIRQYILDKNKERAAKNQTTWDLRIGIHTGPVVAGVVGRIKYAYDIWGSTVNIASRMESNGEPGKVNISAATYELIKHEFPCIYRGKISAKNIGIIDMYFVDTDHLEQQQHTELVSDAALN